MHNFIGYLVHQTFDKRYILSRMKRLSAILKGEIPNDKISETIAGGIILPVGRYDVNTAASHTEL